MKRKHHNSTEETGHHPLLSFQNGSRVLCLGVLLISLFMSLNNFISHSEFWPVTIAKMFGDFSPEILSIYQKPLFHLFLSIPHYFELTNIDHILFARLLFGLLSGINFFLILKLVKRLSGSDKYSFFYGLFLITIHSYFYSMFRVRADLLSLFFLLISCILTLQYNDKKISKKFFYVMFSLSTISLTLCSLKSVYSLLLLATLIVVLNSQSRSKFQTFSSLIYFLFIPFATVFMILSIGSFFSEEEGGLIAQMALKHHLESMEILFSIEGWTSVLRSFNINLLHFVCLAVGLFIGLKEVNSTKHKRLMILLPLACALMIFIHPQRWDYFLASLYPILFIGVIFLFQKIQDTKKISLLLSVLILFSGYMTHFKAWYHTNSKQLDMVEYLDQILQNNQDMIYFDGVGLLPRNKSILWFLGPYDKEAVRHTLKQVQTTEPDFIFYTSKMKYAEPDIIVLLKKNYFEVQPNIWLLKKSKIEMGTDLEIKIHRPLEPTFFFDYNLPHRSWVRHLL